MLLKRKFLLEKICFSYVALISVFMMRKYGIFEENTPAQMRFALINIAIVFLVLTFLVYQMR